MPNITISIDDEVKKIISKRAGKNLLTLREQIEDIIRQSAIRTKAGNIPVDSKVDDRLVEIFSRTQRGKISTKITKAKKKLFKASKSQEEIIVKQNKVVHYQNKKNKKLVEKALKKAESFFNKKIDFQVVFLKTRNELDKTHSYYLKKSYKTPDWLIASTFNTDAVYILSESALAKESSQPKRNFFPSLVYEISHVYLNKLFKFNLPNWIYQGISQVVSEQQGVDGKFTRFLIETYGKSNLFYLISSLKGWKTREDFSKIFKKVLGDDFDVVWSRWSDVF